MLGEAVRAIVLDPARRNISAESELLLMFAARAQLVRELIRPALDAGQWVLSRPLHRRELRVPGRRPRPARGRASPSSSAGLRSLRPDLTLLLDLPIADGLARASGRGKADRIELENSDFFERVRAAYRARAAAEPSRFRVIDATRSLDEVRAAACAADRGIRRLRRERRHEARCRG